MPHQIHRLAPYERRVIELLRNSKDKRARKLAKKRVRYAEGFFSDMMAKCNIVGYFRTRSQKGRRNDKGYCRSEEGRSLILFLNLFGMQKGYASSQLNEGALCYSESQKSSCDDSM